MNNSFSRITLRNLDSFYCGLISVVITFVRFSAKRYTRSIEHIREVNYDAFANRYIPRSCASPEVSRMARFRAIFSFHLLKIYSVDLLCLVYDGGSDVPRICFVQLIILANSSALARTLLVQIFYSSRRVIDTSIYFSRELIQLIKNLDKEHDGAE